MCLVFQLPCGVSLQVGEFTHQAHCDANFSQDEACQYFEIIVFLRHDSRSTCWQFCKVASWCILSVQTTLRCDPDSASGFAGFSLKTPILDLVGRVKDPVPTQRIGTGSGHVNPIQDFVSDGFVMWPIMDWSSVHETWPRNGSGSDVWPSTSLCPWVVEKGRSFDSASYLYHDSAPKSRTSVNVQHLHAGEETGPSLMQNPDKNEQGPSVSQTVSSFGAYTGNIQLPCDHLFMVQTEVCQKVLFALWWKRNIFPKSLFFFCARFCPCVRVCVCLRLHDRATTKRV